MRNTAKNLRQRVRRLGDQMGEDLNLDGAYGKYRLQRRYPDSGAEWLSDRLNATQMGHVLTGMEISQNLRDGF